MSMMSAANSGSRVAEAAKTQASTVEFVIAAATLAVGSSNSLPAAGREGEAAVADQLVELLQDKAVAVEELSLLYCYRFGSSIGDALKSIGFQGSLQDFVGRQKDIHLRGECASVVPEPRLHEDCGKDPEVETASVTTAECTAESECCDSDTESDVDVAGWQSVGTRLVEAFSSDEEDDVSVGGWQSVGTRLVDALAQGREDCEDAVHVAGWQAVGARLASALAQGHLADEEEEEEVDAAAWREVGSRISAAFARSGGEDDA